MKTYYINLDARPDRNIYISQQLVKLFGTSQRVSAKTGSTNDLNYLTGPVKGCVESHKLVYEMVANGLDEFVLILEDDANLENVVDLNKILEIVNKDGKLLDFDCLQIGFVEPSLLLKFQRQFSDTKIYLEYFLLVSIMPRFWFYRKKGIDKRVRVIRAQKAMVLKQKLETFVVADSFLAGTHAYIINRQFAKQLLKMNNPPFLSADLFLMSLSQMCSFKMYRSRSNLVKQNLELKSNIEVARFRRYE